MNYPAGIARYLNHKTGHIDHVGMSGSTVIVYDDCVLKIEPASERAVTTAAVMGWLEGRIPAAKVIHHEIEGGKSWLLMSRMPGVMSCDPEYMAQPEILISALADGLKMLQRTDTAGCPRIQTLDDLLAEARYRVENNLVNLDNVEPETFSDNGFRDPRQLLGWLETNKPESQLCLIHGDYSLPNVFLKGGKLIGFIDLDDSGIGEKWRDIALCYRSLRHNGAGSYGGQVYPNIDPASLFQKLGIEPDWRQIRWHLLLDELF